MEIRFNTPYEVGEANVFLLELDNRLLLVDAAADTDECWRDFQDALAAEGYSVGDLAAILLTHSHPDHVGLVNRIAERRDIPVYAHPDAVPRLTRDPDFLSMRVEFYARLYREMGCGEAGERQVDKLRAALSGNDGLRIRADITAVRESDRAEGTVVLEVPGHAPDHLAFWLPGSRTMFAGDHLLSRISSNAFVEPDRDGRRLPSLSNYVRSMEKCLPLRPARVYAGHGDAIDDAAALIEHRIGRIRKKAESVRGLILGGKSTAAEIAQAFYGDKYGTLFGPVMSEIIGLLDFMEAEGQIRSRYADGIVTYTA
ncbi:MBL fold metallo-hydrolase [Cohnella caldifontis]|uniref:MBL fold metallo-hydrolase n=1 Tax=Cohnella caldifontis TaxID=3027471 RepID=UPI0023EBAA1B|nr:MBL fold metallo-hydrolase [Cohnella sp. YIM B05605]